MTRADFGCPGCSQRLTAEHDALGVQVRCPRCGRMVRPLDVIALDSPIPAIRVLDGEAAAEAAPPPPAADPGAPRTKGGTIVLTPPAAAPPRLSLIDELAGPARALTDAIADRLGPARARIALIATPSVAAPLLVLIAFARPSALRTVVALVVGLLVAAVLVVALALRLAQGRAAGRSSSGRARLAAAGLAALAAGLAFALTFVIAGVLAPSDGPRAAAAAVPSAAPSPLDLPAADTTASDQPPADAELRREGGDSVASGQLFVPQSFRSPDGAFDLIVHLSAQPWVIVESVARADVNALVHVVNLEKGDRYHKHFADPGAYIAMLEAIRTQVEKRGLRAASLRRVAISTFGAGSGALSRILGLPKNVDTLDAVLVLEGMQLRWENKKRERVDPNELGPFLRFAEQAASGQKLFVVSHAKSGGDEERASARAAADALLEGLGKEREPMSATPLPVDLEGAARLFQDGAVHALEPDSAAHVQGFHVLGYANKVPAHQVAQLVQMSVTVLPLLKARWQ
jgi:hypothetical protein